LLKFIPEDFINSTIYLDCYQAIMVSSKALCSPKRTCSLLHLGEEVVDCISNERRKASI